MWQIKKCFAFVQHLIQLQSFKNNTVGRSDTLHLFGAKLDILSNIYSQLQFKYAVDMPI